MWSWSSGSTFCSRPNQLRGALLAGLLLLCGSAWGQSVLQDPEWWKRQLPEAEEHQLVLQLPSRPLDNSRLSSRLEEQFLSRPTLAQEVLGVASTDPEAARTVLGEVNSQLEQAEALALTSQIELLRGNFPEAEQAARRFLGWYPNHPSAPSVYWLMARARFEQDLPIQSILPLQERVLTELEGKFRITFLEMLSAQARASGRLFDALNLDLHALQDARYPDPSKKLQEVLSEMEELPSTRELNRLVDLHPEFPMLRRSLPSIYVRLLMRQGEYERASGLIAQLLPRMQGVGLEGLTESLLFLQQRVQAAQQVQPYRIGVILPMSSNSALVSRLTQQTLHGLRLALHQPPQVPASPDESPPETDPEIALLPQEPQWELVIRDSQLSPEKTREAVRELVEQEHVMAIIGPLTRRTSEAAAAEAEIWEVPLISLSLTSSIAELGEFTFRNNLSWKQELHDLLLFARDYHQVQRVAVLYSGKREGQEKIELFLEEAQRLGVEVVAVEQYGSQQASYLREFETITGIRKETTAQDEKNLEELKDKREPTRSFDAVFVAAGSQGISDLKVMLPYVSVYQLEDTLFLGDSGWSNPALLFAQGNERLRRLVTVNSFFPQSERPEVRRFVDAYEQMFAEAPSYQAPSSYVAYAYDTLELLKHLLRDPRNHSHRELRQALLDLPAFEGATGRLSFDESGEIQREMQLLTIRRGRFVALP